LYSVVITVFRPSSGNFAALSAVTAASTSGLTLATTTGITTTASGDLVIAILNTTVGNAGGSTVIKCATDPSTAAGTTVVSTNPTNGTMSLYVDSAYSVSPQCNTMITAATKTTVGDTGALSAYTGAGNEHLIALSGFTESTPPPPVEGITVDEKLNYTVIEGGAGSASVAISGTVTGSTENIQAQIESLTGTVIVAWTTIASNIATGASYSGTMTVPRGGWYRTRVRKSTTTSTTSVSTNLWGVGLVIGVFGQSLADYWNTYAGPETQDSNRQVMWANGAYASYPTAPYPSYGIGKVQTNNAINTLMDCPVCWVISAQASQPLSNWWTGTKTSVYTAWETSLIAQGGKLSGFIWWQGNQDVTNGTTPTSYMASLRAMLAQIRADRSGPDGIKVIIMGLGRSGFTATAGSVGDIGYEGIRDAHATVAADTGNSLIHVYGLEGDLHLSVEGNRQVGRLIGHAFSSRYGVASAIGRGPIISGATKVSNTIVDVTISHGKGTDFTPVTGITGIDLLDGSGTKVTLASAVRLNATTVRLTAAAVFTGNPTVRSGYGADPDVSAVLKDNTTLAVPLGATLADVVAGAAATKILTDPFRDPVTNALLATTALPNVLVIDPSTRNVILSLSSLTTASDGTLTITDPALTSGVTYLVLAFNSTGASRGAKSFVAG
jgi:hypothetical protein